MSATCRSCEAPIHWAVTAKGGKRIPLDVATVDEPKNAFVIARGRDQGELVAISANWFFAGRSPLLERMPSFHQSHFATCPDAAAHRRSR